jgi:hypothetical protein
MRAELREGLGGELATYRLTLWCDQMVTERAPPEEKFVVVGEPMPRPDACVGDFCRLPTGP